jgi:polyisoprenyl-teichoic acid--peptidoglycan teichoic acid transferase
MARVEKPYRVYRGGRVKGRVPLEQRAERERAHRRRDGREPGKPKIRRPRQPWSWRRRILVALVVLVLLFLIWTLAAFLSVRSGVQAANKRLPADVRPALSKGGGGLLSHSSDILLLGTDHMNTDQRITDFHSDSIILLRTDPSRHRLAYLSIPRDLRVSIPGHGEDKINAAMQTGGPALAIRTVHSFTGLSVNHVLIIDFHEFRKLIDAIGGITVNVPEPILSNKFDCPYASQARCDRWQGWRFAKGPQHMNGWRAQIYSRIRENKLDPSYSDITRGEHQQQVLHAVIAKLTSFSTFLDAPFSGHSYVSPLTTDLSTWDFVQLAWVMKRASASSTLHCRLGGNVDQTGSSDIIPSEDNRAVIGMVTGASAPQPPRPGTGSFGPGCYVGNTGPK